MLHKIKIYVPLCRWQSALVWFLSRIVNQLNNTGMKKHTLVLMAAVSVLAMFSCKRQDPQTKDGGEGFPSPYFFTGILKPESLRIRECTANGYTNEKTDYTSLLLFFSGKNYLQFQKETFEEFKNSRTKSATLKTNRGITMRRQLIIRLRSLPFPEWW